MAVLRDLSPPGTIYHHLHHLHLFCHLPFIVSPPLPNWKMIADLSDLYSPFLTSLKQPLLYMDSHLHCIHLWMMLIAPKCLFNFCSCASWATFRQMVYQVLFITLPSNISSQIKLIQVQFTRPTSNLSSPIKLIQVMRIQDKYSSPLVVPKEHLFFQIRH